MCQIDVHTLWNGTRQKYNSVVYYSFNFLKHIHVQNVHLLPQYTPNNDVEQRDIPSGLSLMEYYFWASRIRWTLNFSIPISREHCLNVVFGDRAKTCITASALSLSVELLFLSHRPFNTSCIVPSTSNLSRILVIVTLVGGGVPNWTLQRHWSSNHSPIVSNPSVTTYVHRMIISPPCLFKNMKKDGHVAMLFQCRLDHTQQKLCFCPI